MTGEIARQWFVPGDGIDRHVIVADIQRYLGNDATVRPGKGTGENEGVPGYWIKAYRNLTTAMISDLRATSGRWNQEQRMTGTREPYVGSNTHHQAQSGRVSGPGRGGESPSVDAYASRERLPSGRMPERMPDRMPERLPERMPERMSERMPDRRPVDRMDVDRMQIDPPMQSQDRRYTSDRNGGYAPDPRQYPGGGFPPDNRSAYPPTDSAAYARAPAPSSSYQDPVYAPRPPQGDGAPPGYVRQGNLYVPVSHFDQPSISSRAEPPSVYGGNPYGQPSQQPVRSEIRDPRDMRDPRDFDGRRRGEPDPRDFRGDPRQPDYAQDPRYAYPSPAATVSSITRIEREPIASPPQPSPYGSAPSYDQQYGGSSRPNPGQPDPRYTGGQPQPSAYGRERTQPAAAAGERDARRRRMQ